MVYGTARVNKIPKNIIRVGPGSAGWERVRLKTGVSPVQVRPGATLATSPVGISMKSRLDISLTPLRSCGSLNPPMKPTFISLTTLVYIGGPMGHQD
jgi:hypothetical protein